MKLFFISFLVAVVFIETHGQVPPGPGGAPGGFIDANDPETYAEIRKLLNEGICEGESCFRLVKINDVKRQVVAGVNYVVNGIFKEIGTRSYYTLTVSIYHVVWENKTERKKLN